jgi:hypothetical protein
LWRKGENPALGVKTPGKKSTVKAPERERVCVYVWEGYLKSFLTLRRHKDRSPFYISISQLTACSPNPASPLKRQPALPAYNEMLYNRSRICSQYHAIRRPI